MAPGTANPAAVEVWLTGTVLVVTVPIWQLLLGALLAVGVILLVGWGCWLCKSRGAGEGGAGARRLRDAADAAGAAERQRPPPASERPAPKASRAPLRAGGDVPFPSPSGRPQVFLTDVGVQGPVTYTGERYLHTTQGFRRGGEVTRETTPYPRPRR